MSDSPNAPATTRTVRRACNLCEAICGLEIEVKNQDILSIRGDHNDPFSRGHICAKAVALKDIHEDPNRLRRPLLRTEDMLGERWVEIDWETALDLAAVRFAELQKTFGNNSVGFYAGNPSVHNLGTMLGIPALARALKTRNAFSASSVDQLPQQLTSLLMFGHQFLIPIPDLDRTQFLLILGANPLASNGSMMTAPDVKKRLAAIRNRGGKIVLLDPRRTETAEVASEHHFIRPATDAALLMAMINILREENLFRLPDVSKLNGLDEALQVIAGTTVEIAARATGIDAPTIRRLAREFAAAPGAVCYGRLGTTLQEWGTVNQWLIQLLNLVSGNLDRVGGALLTDPLLPVTGPGTRPGHYDAWRSRVANLPETGGELPVATLADEILTPGEGALRGLVTICGNPVLSTPDGRRLDRALDTLDFMVSIDIHLNETTRHADLILPPASSLHHDHYDLIFNAFAIRNVARWNPAVWPCADDERYDWEILGGLAQRMAARMQRETAIVIAPAKVIEAQLARLRTGPRLSELAQAISGIDLGALKPGLWARLETPDHRIACAPIVLLDDARRFQRSLAASALTADAPDTFSLIGRRHVRSNNSWMHHCHRLVKGKFRDQLWMHPDDLAAVGGCSGGLLEMRTPTGSLQVRVEATTNIQPGVVSLPHGWGHNRPGTRLGFAHDNPGVSYNDITSNCLLDAVSGNAALNGVRVHIRAID